MRTAIILSAVLHVALFLVAIVGLPRPEKRLAAIPEAIPVEIVDVGQLTNTRIEPNKEPPKPAPAKPQPAPPRNQPPPPPPQAQAEAPPPPPVKTPEPPKQVAQAEPEPKPEPKKEEPKPKPEPKPEPKKEEPKPEPKKPEPKKEEPKKPEPKKEEPKKEPPKKEEPKKEEPKRSFDSVLKNLEKLKEETPPAPRQDPKEEQVAEAPASQSVSRSDRLTISQVDAVRRAIRPCWSVDAGARGVDNYLVVVEANMNPDGTVRNARVVSSTVDRASTDRALRALLNPRCQPFPLPPDQYDDWKVMTVNFNPRDML